MKALFIPDWRKRNPYQTELAESLAIYGVVTDFDSNLDWNTVLSIVRGHHKVDVLHIHWAYPFILGNSLLKSIKKTIIFSLKLSLIKLSGISITWTVHNLFNHDKKFTRLEMLLNRFVAFIADEIIAHSHYAKHIIAKNYKTKESKISIISHGHYINIYPREISREEARKCLELNDNDFVFLYLGVIRGYKGLVDLVEAFKSLSTSNAKLLIAGRPKDESVADQVQRLSNRCPGIRLVMEYIPDDKIQVYMNAADVVVLPYRDILTSGTIYLAMSFAKPVIASATGSVPEILDSKGGFLFEAGDKDGLKRLMEQACKAGPDVLEEMGKYNFKVVEKFDWKNIAFQTTELYKKN